MGILGQPIFIGMIIFVVVCILLLVGIMVLLRNMRTNEQARKKAAVDSSLKSARNTTPQDDFDLFPASSHHDDDDPLAELYQLEDDEGETDLASLLSGIGEEKVHTVATGKVKVRLPSGATTQAYELLSILRDETDGRLMVLAGDKAYRSLLNDPDVKQQFTSIMKDLSTIILKPDDRPEKSVPTPLTNSEPIVTGAAPKASEKKQVMPQPEPAASESLAEDIADEVDLSIKAAKDLEIEERLPGDLPNMKLPDNPDNYEKGRYGWTKIKRVDKAPELNIADAIEAYLQYRIEQHPAYQRRGIHIKPALGGGVKIEADGKAYNFVDEVADPDVRSFIQTAINEWQDRH